MSEVGRVGLVIGATLDNSYYKTLARSSQSMRQLGTAMKEIEKRSQVAKLMELKTELPLLTKKQKTGANEQYSAELTKLTMGYQKVQFKAQHYGLSLSKLKTQHQDLGRVAEKTKRRMGGGMRHRAPKASPTSGYPASGLGEGMKMAGAEAAGMKVPLDIIVTTIKQLHNAGLKSSISGTAFNAMLRQMNRASEELGFQIVRDKESMLDFVSTLQGLKEQVGGMKAHEREGLLQKLFGDEGKKGLGLLIENLEMFTSSLKAVRKSEKDLEETYEKYIISTWGRWQETKNNFKQILQNTTMSFLPDISITSKMLGKLSGGVAVLGEAFSRLISVLTGTVVAAVVALWAAFKTGIVLTRVLTVGLTGLILAFNLTPLGRGVKVLGLLWRIFKVVGVAAALATGAMVGFFGSIEKGWEKISTPIKWLSKFFEGGDTTRFGKGFSGAIKPLAATTLTAATIATSGATSGVTSDIATASPASLPSVPSTTVQATQASPQTITHANTINITQAEGEDGEALAKRVLVEIERQETSYFDGAGQ